MRRLIQTHLDADTQNALANLDAAKAFQTLEPEDIEDSIHTDLPEFLPWADAWLNLAAHWHTSTEQRTSGSTLQPISTTSVSWSQPNTWTPS